MQNKQDNKPTSKNAAYMQDSLAQFPAPAMRIDSCGSLVYANSEAKSLARTLGIDLIALMPEGHARNVAHALTSLGDTVIAWPMTYGNGQILQWSYRTDVSDQTVMVFAADVTRLAKATLTHQTPTTPRASLEPLADSLTSGETMSLDFLRCLPVPAAILNKDMQYIAVSTPWKRAFLQDIPSPIGRSHYDCVHVPQVLRAAYRLALGGECSKPIETSYICPKTGRMEWVRAQACPWRYKDGTIGGLFLLNTLTTESRQQEAKDKRADESAIWQKKLETLGAVVGGIAHEINSPAQYISDNLSFLADARLDILNLIDTYRQAIAEFAPSSDALHQIAQTEQSMNLPYLNSECGEAIKQASSGIEEITRIVEAIKTFANIEAKSSSAADVNTILKDSILVCKYRWKDIAKIKTDFDDKLPHIMVYPDQIGQVFLILLMNAIHAIEDKHSDTCGEIEVSTQAFKDHIAIHIDDNGIGIPAHSKKRIFEPHFTTKAPNRGSGRGLSSAKKIVEEYHGGQIICDSTNRLWTRFTVVLPYKNSV